jgi:hypothetical protein
MFQDACETARKYTFPYVGLRRKHDGTVFSTVAAFVLVNAEGWAITAKHVFDEIEQAQRSIEAAAALDAAIESAHAHKGAGRHANRDVQGLQRDKADSLSNRAEIWSAGIEWDKRMPQPTEVRPHQSADVVAFKLEPFTPAPDAVFPVFRAGSITPGLSVCRIGFPWHTVQAEFSENNFDVKSGFPVPLFAVEGIVSRLVVENREAEGSATYIQTSNPGLRGQSGGPLFDVGGRVCGLQSSTTHLDLGFDARYERDGHTVVERQFLNVGQAVHVDDIRRLLDENGIAYVVG